MSDDSDTDTAPPEPTPGGVECFKLKAPTLDEIALGCRQCDLCFGAQIYGCHAAIVAGYRRLEICRPCWDALRKGVAGVK